VIRSRTTVRRRAPAWTVGLLLGCTVAATVPLGAAPGPDPPLRIVVIGDINASYGSVGYGAEVHAAVRRIVQLKPDLVLAVGDLVAGQQTAPRLDTERLEAMWRAFDEEVLDPVTAAGIPFVPVPGNHDASAEPGFALERRVAWKYWRDRRPRVDFAGNADGWPFRYAFTFRDVLFVVLDATTVGPLSAGQKGWLEHLLGASVAPSARVVAAHLPLHPLTHGRERETLADPELERILASAGVDLFLSGHHHAYYPGFRAGLLQVGQGCLGSGPRRLIGAGRRAPRSFTLVEIDSGGHVRVEALAEPDFTAPIDPALLPEAISHDGAALVREDLARGRGAR